MSLPMQHAQRPPARAARAGRPIRVLMGMPAPGATAGGPALHLPMLVEDLRQGGDVEIVTMPYGRWEEGESLPRKILHQIVDAARYPARLRAAAPDVVHLNTALDRKALLRDACFVFLTRAMNKRIFLKWHGSETELLVPGAGAWGFLAQRLLRGIDGLGVLSGQERDEVMRHPGAPRCFVVKNCIDASRYAERFDLQAHLGLAPGTPLLLFISRLIPAKGLEDVLRALPEVAARHGAQLLVVGDGPSRRAAEALTDALGLRAAVHFFGALPEAEAVRFYTGADILVFPSYHAEGFPMVLFQSVVAGLGIVTTRLRAALDHLREPDHCLYVEPHAPATVAAALERLLADRELLRRMRANNRLLRDRFERRSVAAEFRRIYREITRGAAVDSPAGSPSPET